MISGIRHNLDASIIGIYQMLRLWLNSRVIYNFDPILKPSGLAEDRKSAWIKEIQKVPIQKRGRGNGEEDLTDDE
jgi:hypothetical protein